MARMYVGARRSTSTPIRTVTAAAAYFILVFGAGFVLGSIRLPFLVPRLGERTAELLLAVAPQGRSVGQYLASRDPVSGSVYLGALILFAAMPSILLRLDGLPPRSR